MNLEILTKEDLNTAVKEIVEALIPDRSQSIKKYLRSAEVRKLLGISAGTLQNLRINGTIPYTSLGTTKFYDYAEIVKILDMNNSAHQ